MAFLEYVLVALLGSTAAAPGVASGGSPVRTFTAESVTQPAGGDMSSAGVANTNSSGKKRHKGGKKGHKGGKKGKKSSGSTTPPPK